ncbi:MAG: hypothetical protein ACXQTE_03170 [Methanosarcinaceae archaeon]
MGHGEPFDHPVAAFGGRCGPRARGWDGMGWDGMGWDGTEPTRG